MQKAPLEGALSQMLKKPPRERGQFGEEDQAAVAAKTSILVMTQYIEVEIVKVVDGE